jgi:hydrogenase maturation protein HypF
VIRVAVRVRGVVQGVGFRPFVHGAATARGLAGWIRNATDGPGLEVEDPEAAVREFLDALRHDPPPAAYVERVAQKPQDFQARFGVRYGILSWNLSATASSLVAGAAKTDFIQPQPPTSAREYKDRTVGKREHSHRSPQPRPRACREYCRERPRRGLRTPGRP